MPEHDTSSVEAAAEESAENEIESISDEISLASGEVAWDASTSMNGIRNQIESVLNKDSLTYGEESTGYSYWVEDVNKDRALVCSGSDHWVVGFSVSKGNVTVDEEDQWQKVDKAWVELSLASEDQLGAEMHLSGENETVELGSDGYIWKTILREGTWKMSPGPGQKPMPKPITVTKTGKSDGNKLIISMDEIKNNFDAGSVEHVTIPTSHRDTVLENTGYVKGLKFDTDSKGRTVLKAAHDFTEPDVKEKALRGTIANTSAGILFDYVNKETGKKNSAVLGHVALTNHPWLNDMNPFGVLASENLKVMQFSEEKSEIDETDESSVGGEVMSSMEIETPETPKFLTDLGLSEDQAVERLARFEELEKRDRENTVKSKVSDWESDKKSPAMVLVAKALLSAADETETVLNLSEDGKTVGLTAVDIIDRLMEAAPSLELAEDKVTDKDVEGERPETDAAGENDRANLSQAEKTLTAQLWLEEGFSENEAVAEAKRRLSNKSE